MKISLDSAADAGMTITLTPGCDHEKALLDRIQADHSIIPPLAELIERLQDEAPDLPSPGTHRRSGNPFPQKSPSA